MFEVFRKVLWVDDALFKIMPKSKTSSRLSPPVAEQCAKVAKMLSIRIKGALVVLDIRDPVQKGHFLSTLSLLVRASLSITDTRVPI